MTGALLQAKLRFALDEHLTVLSVTPGIQALLGYSAEDLLSSSVHLKDRIHCDDADIAALLFSTPIDRSSGAFDFRLRHADGNVRCVRGQYNKKPARNGRAATLDLLLKETKIPEAKTPLFPPHGQPTSVQDASAEANENYRNIFDGAVEGMFRTTLDGRVLIANKAVARILGYDSSEDVVDSITNLARDVWHDPVERARYLQKMIENDEHAILGYECLFKRKDGKPIWVSVNGRLVYKDDGTIAYHDGFFMEITERKQAEAALRASEESLKDAQRISGLGSYVTDLRRGVWTGSEVLDQLFGIDKNYDHSVEGWTALVHPDDQAPLVDYFRNEVIGQGKPFNREFRIIRQSDQALRWVHGLGWLERDAQGQPAKMHGTLQDTTERRLTDSALRESEESLKESQRIAGLGSYVADLVTGRWTSSDVMDQLFGIGKDYERTIEGWAALIHPDDRAAMVDYFANEVVSQGKPFDREYHIVRPSDGAVRWVHGLGRLEFDAQGRPVKMHGTIKDITERKQIEIALLESQERLQLFIEHAPVALAMFDREMRYLAVSHRWARDHSIAEREIIGRSHYEINPEVPERWKETHRRGLAGERQRSDEDRYDRGDGSLQWIRWEIIPWRDAEGEIGGIVMFYEDITERRRAEADLRESKDLLQLFITHAPAALAMFDRDMRYVAASRRWLTDNALAGRDLIGRSHYDVDPDIPERWRDVHRRALAGESARADEDRFERPDGSVHWVRWEVIPWFAGDGTVGGIILFAEDITRQRQVEERLRLAASVFTQAREGIVITDPNAIIIEVNDMFTRMTGYTREEVLGRNPSLLASGLQSREFYEEMWRALLKDGHWSGELWNRTKNGDLIAETMTITAVRDANGDLLQFVALFSDITQLKKHAQQLEHLTHYDLLTSLPNRALLADRLQQAMAQANRRRQVVVVAYLDLDAFKAINDEHGRDAGDRLLTALAFNIKCALREGDTLARLGGDEFVAVMIDLDSAEASMPVIASLLEAAAEPVQVGDLNLHVSASIGVTFYPRPERADADLLLRQADQAMYQAKLAGGNCYHIFDPEHDNSVRGRRENLEHIRQALAAREFVLYYQPKVNMRTGKVVGAEALIRWHHPERGLMPPGMFLPVIEDHPLAIEVGEWVLETALAQMESWHAAGLEMPVSVNVGALQLQQPDFVDRLSSLLSAHPGVKPFSLEIEVLETSALQDVVQTSQVLNACHSIGVSFALDDFGTGYSSLTYLKRLPASVLKIDQSFVSDMLEDPENLNILEGVLSLASAFHRQVIAEGVETVEHGLMLLQLGCELAQGYGIARPMPAGDLPAWVSAWRPDARWAEVPSMHSGNRALLYARVEHRAWIAAFEAFLQGKRHSPPQMDQQQCRFGAWLEGERQNDCASEPLFQSVEATHRQIHALAAEIVETHSKGRSSEALGRLGALHQLSGDLLEQLEALRREC